MARQPYFSGNYGSALAQVDTRPIMQGAAAQAAMYQGLGQNIGGAIEKYQLNKEKADTADMMIGAYLQNMPEDKQLELQNSDTDLGKSLKKLSEGELTTSKKIALAGALGVMQTQAKTAAEIAESEARASYYKQPRHAPTNPKDIATAEAIRDAMQSMGNFRQGGGRGGRGRGAQAPPGAPGLPGIPGPGTGSQPRPPGLDALIASGTQRALGATPGGGPQQPLPPSTIGNPFSAITQPPALPPQTGAVGRAMTAPPPPKEKRKGKYKNLSRPERNLVRWANQNPGAAAVLEEEVYGGGIKELRDRSREWGRKEIGVAQEVLDKDGLPTGTVLIPTSPTTQLVQSASEVKPNLYAVQELDDGSSQQYMGNGNWVELKKDEFETKKDAEKDAQRLAGLGISAKTSFNKTTGRFNVEVTEGATRAFVEVKDPDFKGRMMYHPDTKQFWTMGKNGKMRPMVEDAVTVIGSDAAGDDIVVLNGGSTPYIQNDKGLTEIQPSTMRPEARMTLYNQLLAPLQRDPMLIDYIRAKDMSEQDGETKGTGKNRVFHFTDENNEDRTKKYDQDLEDKIKNMATYMAEMQAVRLAFPLQR